MHPIEGAGVFITTEHDGENTFFTDSNGKLNVALTVGVVSANVYAEGCVSRNLKIKVTSGEHNVPQIGLSDKPIYNAEAMQHVMTYEEMIDDGIDVQVPDNYHVVKYELNLSFDPQIDNYSLLFYWMTPDDETPSSSGGG